MSEKKDNKQHQHSEEMIDDNKVNMDATETEVAENESFEREATASSGDELTELRQQLGEQKDKFLRLYAEFENYKKRAVREKLDLMKSAAQDTLSALLPVLDDFDRAKKTAETNNKPEEFSEGIQLVYHKLYSIAQSKGLRPMESTGEVFDPEFHEAFAEIPAPTEDMKGKVIDTIEKGYFLHDKIIRHAKVVVGK
ncbi:MAG TPA: nucleotide exchange factor GrpE [Saprospiraceae bacterium]|nr:nucleotide exchange factor GrpE [Saprospiraceae bacterium]